MLPTSSPTKSTAELRVLCYPAEAIPATTGRNFGVCDTILNLLFRASGEAGETLAGFGKKDFRASDGWYRQTTFKSIGPNIDFALFSGGKIYKGLSALVVSNFAKSVMSSSPPLSGFYLLPRLDVRNNTIEAAPKGILIAKTRAPRGGDFAKIRWRHRRGEARIGYDQTGKAIKLSAWITSIPDRLPRRTFVTHSHQTPDKATEIETMDVFPALQQTVWELIDLAEARDNKEPGGVRLMWGGRANSLELRRREYPAICRARPDAAEGSENEWEVVQRITEWGKFEFVGDLTVTVENIGGRLGLSMFDGQGKGATWDFPAFSMVPGDAEAGAPPQFETTPWEWPKGTLGFSAQGVSAHVGVSLLDLSEERKVKRKTKDKKGRVVTVEETKRVPLRDEFARMPQTLPPGSPPPLGKSEVVAGGFFATGTTATVTANVTTAGKLTTVDYKCALQSNLVVSPLVSHVGGKHEGEPELTDYAALDISGALVGRPRESGAALGAMSSKEFTFDVDRFLLEGIAPSDGAPLPINDPPRPWTDFVAKDNPIEISSRWRYTDGSYSDWSNRLQGYIVTDEKATDGALDWQMKILARDKLHRLTDPAGMIDETDGPLDLLLWQSDGEPVYGTDMAAAIVANKLGPVEAGRINGGGENASRRFYGEDHPAMMSIARNGGGLSLQNGARIVGAPNKAGFDFPPLWNRDAMSWLEELAKQDFSTFFYGHVSENGVNLTDWPCLIWGDLSKILQGRPIHELPDAVYDVGDADKLLLALRIAQKAPKRINEVKVWASPPGESSQLPFPATKMATARLPAGDPNSADRSWRRTQIVESQSLWPGGWAQEVASLVIRGLEDVEMHWPRLTCRGMGEIQEGDELTVKQLHVLADSPDRSDLNLGLSGDSFRVLHAEQSWDLERHNWVSELEVFPLSLFERLEKEEALNSG